jgi:hypothetical protein
LAEHIKKLCRGRYLPIEVPAVIQGKGIHLSLLIEIDLHKNVPLRKSKVG